MPSRSEFELDTKVIGALPLVNGFLRRLRFEHFLEKHLPPPDPRVALPPRVALLVLVRNLVIARVPLYGLGEWADQRIPGLLGLRPDQVELLNDDRVGRALDRLFDSDRGALLTDLVVHVVREFDVALDQFHNDSTTLSLQGEYDLATGKLMRGKPTLVVTFGLSKDLRPDLKQLLWILTVSADGAIPVHFRVADGNTEDSTTHIETWDVLCLLVGSPHFLYVADCKLCTRDNLKHIHEHGGQFITVLPRTRKEDELFRDWLQQNTPAWEEVARKPHPRLQHGPPDIFRAFLSPIPDSDGYQIIWYQSSHKIERDAEARRDAIQSAWKRLEQLRSRLEAPRPRFKSRASVAQAAEKILQETRAERWIGTEVTPVDEPVFRQEKRGRPGKNTRWRRRLKIRFRLSWGTLQQTIDYDARCDGIFPLITNQKDPSAAAVLEAYKSKQPLVEKRHDLLKNIQAATPMYLKNIGRIEALLFLEFVALMIQALIERELRQAMKARGIGDLPLYPEERECKAPSTARVLEILEPLQRHLLRKKEDLVQRFDPELNDLQRKVVGLLGLSQEAFANC